MHSYKVHQLLHQSTDITFITTTHIKSTMFEYKMDVLSLFLDSEKTVSLQIIGICLVQVNSAGNGKIFFFFFSFHDEPLPYI